MSLRGGHHLFQLLGPIYGQRCASRAWYVTLSDWLLEVGFECSKNDPCLFVNSETGVQLAIHVDDIICRGNIVIQLRNGLHLSTRERESSHRTGHFTLY